MGHNIHCRMCCRLYSSICCIFKEQCKHQLQTRNQLRMKVRHNDKHQSWILGLNSACHRCQSKAESAELKRLILVDCKARDASRARRVCRVSNAPTRYHMSFLTALGREKSVCLRRETGCTRDGALHPHPH
jgi:hypothetical protein